MSDAYLMAGFDLALIGTVQFTVTDDDITSQAFTFTTGTYAHRDMSSVMGSGEYTEFWATVEAAVNAASTDTHTISYNASTYEVTWSTDASVLFIDFMHADADVNTRSKALIGFTADRSGATSYSSQVRPYYVLELARDGVSDFSDDFEPEGQTRREVSVNATAYSVEPLSYEVHTDLKLRFQTRASIFKRAASSAEPWTYRHMVEHCRAREPILHSYNVEDTVLKLVEPEFTQDLRRPVWNDYHALWDVRVIGQVLGRL